MGMSSGQYRTTLSDLSYTERLQVDEMARQIKDGPGVATIDMKGNYAGGTGKRHRLRYPLEQLLGFKVDYGIDTDDDGERFGWFTRHEEPIPEEQRLARERIFGQD